MGFRIRAATDADAEEVRRVVGAAFGGERVPRLVDALSGAGDVLAGLVAVSDADPGPGEVVGHVLLSRSWVDARERLVDVAVLSPLSTRPDWEGHGVGTALVAAAIEEARRRGEPAVFLEGDPAFYSSRGFADATALGFTRPSARVPAPAFQVAVLDEDVPRGPLVYCQTFWTEDCVGLRDPRLAAVEEALASER